MPRKILTTRAELAAAVREYAVTLSPDSPLQVARMLVQLLDHAEEGELMEEVERRGAALATERRKSWYSRCATAAMLYGRHTVDVMDASRDAGRMPRYYDEDPEGYQLLGWINLLQDAVIEARNQ